MTDNAILGRNTREWSRIVRSGIAGGIAGCVVSFLLGRPSS